jgi:uracil-DNA glycosylase
MANIEAFRALAAELDRIDVGVYTEFGKDPLEPIIGLGDRRCRLAVMGRDPGRHEVEHGVPFIGAGGQLVRRALFDAMNIGKPLEEYDLDASREVGRNAFWCNTVPYKPVQNKAWGIRCKRRFHPLLADVLVHDWDGHDVLALGRGAFDWFGLTDKALKAQLADFWEREDRYLAHVTVVLTAQDGTTRTLRVHPVPHPSPLNATWYRKVPGLLAERLRMLEWGPRTWRMAD